MRTASLMAPSLMPIRPNYAVFYLTIKLDYEGGKGVCEIFELVFILEIIISGLMRRANWSRDPNLIIVQ